MAETMTTDMDRLREAFTEFRKKGYWARMNQDEGYRAVPEDLIRRGGKWICWHSNETAMAFDPAGNLKAPLHLRHPESVTDDVVKTLARFDLPFRTRVAVDHSPLGGVVVNPVSPKPMSTTSDRQLYVGRRYIMPSPMANEWYVAAASTDTVQLVAKDVPQTWIQMLWRTFHDQLVAGSIVPVQEAA